MRIRLLLLACCLLAPTVSGAQPGPIDWAPPAAGEYVPPVLEAPVCVVPPVIDGILDDACWERAYYTNEFWDTLYDSPPAERTEFWVCVDEEALYLAVLAHESRPQAISAQQTKRDGSMWRDDHISLSIDPTCAGANLYSFSVNARGTQADSVPGGSEAKVEWRGDWTAAASRVPEGWTVEMRIPFELMRYPAGQSIWRISLTRRHARTNTRWNWPPQRPPWETHRIAELCGLALPPPRISPVIMLTTQMEAADGDWGAHFSLDAKTQHPTGLTGLFSWQPLFRDVEQEVESIDFSYVERRLADRRPFFVEGGGYMPPAEVLYTLRIPEFDVGLKTFGTVGSTDVGLLDAYSFEGRNDLALGVHQRLGAYHSAGVAYVRTDQEEFSNDTLAARGSLYWPQGTGGYRLSARWADTHTSGEPGGEAWGAGARWDLGTDLPNLWFDYGWTGAGYDPKLGYVPEPGVRGWSAGGGWTRRFAEGNLERTSWSASLGDREWLSGDLLARDLNLSHAVRYRNGWRWSVGRRQSDRPPNLDQVWSLSGSWNTRSLTDSGGISLRWGELDGAQYLYAGLSQGYQLDDRLSFSASYDLRRSLYPDERGELLTRGVLSFNYDLTPERGFGGRVLTGTGGTNLFVSYRQAVRRGMDLFVIFGDPNAETTQSRAALKAKWAYR